MGPKRYVATLGVVFDRERASRYLGASGQITRSAPLLLLPVTFSGGVELLYEQRNEWQRAWAEYQAGASRIDYVRPSGSGGESLLLTYGQTGRRSRTWWRNVLDQFNASDVLVPIARLDYEYPGGPVNGTFSARYGPDSILLETFTMRAENSAQLPAMLDRAVLSFNGIFERALASGRLKPDPTLEIDGGELTPVVARLVELGRQYRAQDAAAARRDVASPSENAESDGTITDAPVNTPPPEGSVALYTVQFATPDAEAFDSLLAAVRGTPGVRNAGTRSTAIGGTSVMTVSYGGSIGELAAALRARGLTVQQGSSALSISR
ncbi:heavy-metal-associated domain-containing protein [Erythrobacter litoralis]|nr:heavy-metal-associated domain-containing protein [Erythrobacter litoralis]